MYNSNHWCWLANSFIPKVPCQRTTPAPATYYLYWMMGYSCLAFWQNERLWKKIYLYLKFVMFFWLLVFLSNEHFLVCFSATVIKKKKTNQSQLRQGRDYYILQIVVHHQGKPQKQFSRNWRQELKQRPGTLFSLFLSYLH